MRKTPLASPFFAWTDAVLRGGMRMLDSMREATQEEGRTRVGVVPTADAPPPGGQRKARAGGRRRKNASRRR